MRVPDAEKLTILLPPLPAQRKIAAILSAYDDLIENNTRRIAILEQMAQALYREWFVHFRFPGHENVRMVDSPLGLVPVGWEVATIQDVSSYINRGISPKYDDEADAIVINQRCIRNGKLDIAESRRHRTTVLESKRVQLGDVLINSTGVGTLGRVAQVYEDISDCTVDSHVTIVRPAGGVGIDYFGLSLLARQPSFESQGVGSTGQTELSRSSIATTELLLPPTNFRIAFGCSVGPMRLATKVLARQNANLRRTRDLLLPRLVSGEVEVEGLEIDEGGDTLHR